MPSLTRKQASDLARLALRGLGKEYPNKPEHVMAGPDDVKGPKALHPAFYGSYDWHSSVHGHWMLVRLLRRSGKPIVATRLLTHTQVLSDETAILTGTSPREFAGGIIAALQDPGRAAAVGARARDLAETKYSYDAYLDRTRQACAALECKRGAMR